MISIVVTTYYFVYHFVIHVNVIMTESKLFCNIFILKTINRNFERRWFAIKDTYIAYLRPDLNELRFPLLVDRGFEFVSGIRNAGSYHGIKIKNLQRTLVVKCRTTRDCDEWFQHLTNLKAKASGFVNDAANRFNSYAPVREKQLAYW